MSYKGLRDRLPENKTKEQLKEHYKAMEDSGVDKKQERSMILAALLTILPVVILLLAAIYGIMWLLFLRF